MPAPNPKAVAFKVFLYMFDLLSDWVNGILLLIGGGDCDQISQNGGSAEELAARTVTAGGNATAELGCEGKVHPIWGTLTIALSWVPALFGLFALCLFAADSKSKCRDFLLLPVRFLLWPLILPVLM